MLALALTSWTAATSAADINSLQTLSQADFKLLSEDLGAALSFKPLIPAEPLGLTGFDIGLALTGTQVKNEAILRRATGGDSVSTIAVPTLRAHKGLPWDIDVGLAYAAVPNSNIKLVGGELRWAILAGTVATPALAIRLSHARASGVDQLKFNTTGIDLSISKGFAFFTPYGGVGVNWVNSTPRNVPFLAGENFRQSKIFGGVNVSLGLVNLAFEVDSTGGANSYGGKLGLRF